MSAPKTRRNRLKTEAAEQVLTRLSPAAKRMLQEAAAASGTSLSLYLETLVHYETQVNGKLPVWNMAASTSEVTSVAA
jgi:hypothetical protein